MRTVLDEVRVSAATATLPAPQETVRVPLGRSGPRARGDGVDLPAFTSDPRSDPRLPAHLRRRIDRFSALAYLAVETALSEMDEAQRPPTDRIGVFLANTRAGWSYGEPELGLLVDQGPVAMHAYQATAWFPAAAQGEVTIALDLRGCAKTAAGRLSGFGEAVWLARDALERGAVDVAVVGAAESLVNGFVLRDWADADPLPVRGAAEGAVVFALTRPTGGAGPLLRDLRLGAPGAAPDGTAPPSPDPAGAEWVPTLSAAQRLHEALRAPPAGAGTAVALGGGYWITVEHTEKPIPKEGP